MNHSGKALALLIPLVMLCSAGCVTRTAKPESAARFEAEVSGVAEEIYIHRTVRVAHQRGASEACASAPFPVANEDVYELWSLRVRPADSRVTDSHVERVGSFRACIGALAQGRPFSIYVITTLKDRTYTGLGECTGTPSQPPVRTVLSLTCVASLSHLPPEYAGGVIVTSTLAPVTGGNQPVDAHVRGYLSTSVLVVRLWKKAA